MSESSFDRRRGRGRPFVKGQSGNPGGRPKSRALRVALEQRADDVAAALIKAFGDPDATVRLEAIKLACAYLLGKPSEVPLPSPGELGEALMNPAVAEAILATH